MTGIIILSQRKAVMSSSNHVIGKFDLSHSNVV
jgi:hypothetical protein